MRDGKIVAASAFFDSELAPELVHGQDGPAFALTLRRGIRRHGLPSRSSFMDRTGRLRAARYGAASFACIRERRMVDLTGIEPVTS